MNSRHFLTSIAASLVLGGVLVFALRSKTKEEAPGPPFAASPPSVSTKANSRPAPPHASSGEDDADKADEVALTDPEREALLAEIEQLSVTYDAKELPKIEPYLLHRDPEVRQAAMNGMIVLGDTAAAPLLREAAKKVPTPQEAVALTEAAEYMELPAGSFIPKDRTKEGARVPSGTKPAPRERTR